MVKTALNEVFGLYSTGGKCEGLTYARFGKVLHDSFPLPSHPV